MRTHIGMRTHGGRRTHIVQAYSGYEDTYYRFVGYANTYTVGEDCGHIYCRPSRYADTYIAGILGMRAHIAQVCIWGQALQQKNPKKIL